MKTVGIIGLRNHAQRLRNLLEPIARVIKLYHPTGSIDDPRCTQEFNDLLACDAVIIASPNDTHFSYLMMLADASYPGYIFCEKPVAGSPEQLLMLGTHGPDPTRIMIDYTYRYSSIATSIRDAVRHGSLGRLIAFSAVISNGLAFKQSFPGSWRSQQTFSVIETLGVHMVDLMIWACNLHGRDAVSTIDQRSRVLSVGPAPDTSRITIQMDSGVMGDILVSYAMPFAVEVSVIGTDGVFHARDGRIVVRSPRDTFDERGFFVTPPTILSADYDPESMYEEALANAVGHFMSVVEVGGRFDRERYDTSWALSAFV